MRVNVRQERGAVAVIVAILLIVLFGFAAFALDTGNAWQSRRHLVTATDAAALAAARDFALGTNGCAGTDDAMVTANFAGSTVDSCSASTASGPGYVTVRAGHDVEWNFARIFGLNNTTIHSSTALGTPLSWRVGGRVSSTVTSALQEATLPDGSLAT